MMNGTHLAMSALAGLTRTETVAEFVEDPLLAAFMRRLMFDELRPSARLGGPEAHSYGTQLIARWSNRGLRHRFEQIGRNGSQKIYPRLLVPLLDNVREGRPTDCLRYAVAAWVAWATELVGANRLDGPFDPLAHELRVIGQQASGDALVLTDALLAKTAVFGDAVDQLPALRVLLADAISDFQMRDVRSVIGNLLGSTAIRSALNRV
jgi:fructuronate reductase